MKKSRTEYLQAVHLEKSKSATEKHAYVSVALILDKKTAEVKRILMPHSHKPSLYAKGEGEDVEVSYGPDEILVLAQLVRTPLKDPKRRVKGKVVVFDKEELTYIAVYRELKLRGSKGKPHYFRYVRAVMKYLKLPVKRENPDAHLPKRGGGRRH
jgi:hypothetical protein